jgi:hypothetical protein
VEVTMKIALLMVLLAVAAQIPACGEDQESGIVGWVEAKRVDGTTHSFVISINHVEYDVPSYFWSLVTVGDLVKWDGKTWTIVKKAGT